MFRGSYEIAKNFTQPLVVTLKFYDKTIEGGLGSFIIVNDDGWLMTAAHNFEISFAFNQHQSEINEYNEKVEKVNSNIQFSKSKKKALLRRLNPNKKWVTNFAILLGGKPINILETHIYGKHDIAFFRVDKAVIAGQTEFPSFIDPTLISPGISLCKLGFPFREFIPTFDDTTNQFNLPSDLLPLPLFPIEGIYTRNILTGESEGGIEVKYLETSSPGLKGQSGGPIFDEDGDIYAIQSKNVTMPLGFTGKIEIKGKTVEENQFLNVGIGVHPETLIYFMDKHGINYKTSA